jgi:signal transduction histidine kinase
MNVYTLVISDTLTHHYAADALMSAFPATTYHLVALPQDHIASALRTDAADAVIAPLAPTTEQLFSDLATHSAGYPPLRVLVPTPAREQPPPPLHTDTALGGASGEWSGQLLPLLKMRARLMALETENAQIKAENARLTQVGKSAQDQDLDVLRTAIIHNVGHELKTPLLQIKTAVNGMGDDPTNPRYLDFAVQATARLEEVVQNIGQIAQSTKITLDAALLRDSVDYALRNLRHSWRYKDHVHRVQVNLPPNLPPVLMDKRAIGTVLHLLTDNALKFSDGEVNISAKRERDKLRVSVADSGIGIPTKMREEIFELFVQGDPKSTRKFGGVGIGLYLVRLIIERHQTEMIVKSRPGRGSTFSFTLPVVELA